MRALGLMLVALVVTGCGGSGLSRGELASKANAICTKYGEKAKALASGSLDLKDSVKAADYFTRAHALAQEQETELTALKPDADAKAGYVQLTQATGAVTKLFGDLATAAKAKDRKSGAKLLEQLPPLVAQVNESAKAAGTTKCAGSR